MPDFRVLFGLTSSSPPLYSHHGHLHLDEAAEEGRAAGYPSQSTRGPVDGQPHGRGDGSRPHPRLLGSTRTHSGAHMTPLDLGVLCFIATMLASLLFIAYTWGDDE